ncbi:MAG: Rieske 2Fe-2S domain-containing protein [Pseudomonadales bacterium]|nr:Rieske 2Fe-2S domain-containing protein [Pseudomonadales bacterium]
MLDSRPEVIARDSWVDVNKGTVDRRIFSDLAIYQQELKRIFARGWNFICHETQIAEPGRFFQSYIGEDQVIAVRDRSNTVQVLLNSCPHRGNTVCRSDQGKTRSFFCSYHGWNFDLDGKLVGVPGYEDYYREKLKKEDLGLAKAARVQSYKGFVFASLDPQAPDLEDYLGWVGMVGLNLIAEIGDMEVIDGIQKNRIQCNWKLAVDNLYDWYHPKVSHGSAVRAGMINEQGLQYMNQMVMLGEYGHGIGGAAITEENLAKLSDTLEKGQEPDQIDKAKVWRTTEKAANAMGPLGIRCGGHPNIFPNLWVSAAGPPQLCLRIPRGPFETELWWFTFAKKDQTPEERRATVMIANHIFGPSGLLEQDDGENWSHSTRGSVGAVTGERPIDFSMGLGQDKMTHDSESGQSCIETVVNEHAQLWLYRSWEEWMKAEDWPALIKNHSLPPTGKV